MALPHSCLSAAPEVSVSKPTMTAGKGDVQVHHSVTGLLCHPRAEGTGKGSAVGCCPGTTMVSALVLG